MKALRIPLLAALAGVVLLIVLFPRVDPSAAYGTTMDRGQAIHRARQLSSQYGVDTTGWPAIASEMVNETLHRYFNQYPNDPAAKTYSPVSWGVQFTEPAGKRKVRVELFSNGKLSAWEVIQPADVPPPAASSLSIESLKQDFAGSNGPLVEVGKPTGAREGWRGWEWQPGNSRKFPLAPRLEVVEQNGRLVSVELTTGYLSGFDPSSKHIGAGIGKGLAGLLSVVGFWIAFALAIGACLRGTLSWRVPVVLAVAMMAWMAFISLAGGEYQSMKYAQGAPPVKPNFQVLTPGAQTGYNVGLTVGIMMRFIGPACLPFLAGFVFGGAGYARARGAHRKKWQSLEFLCQGKIFSRQVSQPIAAGMLWGIAATAAPFVIAAILRGVPLLFHSKIFVLSAPFPASTLLQWSAIVPAFGFLGFALPMAEKIRSKAMRIVAEVALGATYLMGAAVAFDSLAPSLFAAAIAMGVYLLLYWQFDLLAVCAAMMMTPAVLAPSILLSQPAGALRESGLTLLVLVAAGLVAFVNFGIRGADSEAGAAEYIPMPETTSGEAPSLSNRKRLEAEFQVARKAQQDALPTAPPTIDGYSVAGSCDPALQVGGDLFDLFSLPDGRFGIAVADVSGKGVPAALYMMVTKGLLTAATQDSSDLPDIVRQINAHLYRACKRKVFVTMAAIAVDPVGRRLQYVRAGHNPIVWRRAGRGETLLRTPPGLGLGMCPNDPFTRSMRPEELHLEPGDAVVLYSDGITEAINASMEQFGEERLIRSIERADGKPAEETRVGILRDLAEFAAGTPARDDVTLVVLRVDGAAFSDSKVCATIS